MTSTEIAVRENGHAVAERDTVDGWVGVVSDVINVANLVNDTDFVPAEYRGNGPAVAAAILTGRELGIGPMMSLRHVQIVKGVPTLSAEYKRARALAAGHDFEITELNTQWCKVRGRRAGTSKWLEVAFTMDDAQRAGLIKDKGAWKTRPRRMLFARASTELCDFLFADVTNGLPTAELVASGTDDDEFAGYDESPGQAAPAESNGHAPAAKPAPRTAQRRQRATPATAATVADAPPAAVPATAQTAPADAGLPPLPGEEPGEPEVHDKPKRGNGLTGVIHQHFRRLGFTDDKRGTRLRVTAKLAGLAEIKSTDDLDDGQKRAVADTLARCKDQERLGLLLAELNAQAAAEASQEAGGDG